MQHSFDPNIESQTVRRHSIKDILLTTFIIITAGPTACRSATLTSPTNTPIPVIPTATLELAENYTSGTSNVPTGTYLFVELYSYDVCSNECQCPAVEPPMWAYGWPAGELCINNEEYYDQYFPDPAATESPASILGLFGAGRWQEYIKPITTFPYKEYYIPIYGVETDGSIVVGIQGNQYFLRPGQSWVETGTVIREPPSGCTISYKNRLTNYGFIEKQQIKRCE